MENLFSFKYAKLAAALGCLLMSSFGSGVLQYFWLVIGGAFLMTAFASFASYGYRGFESKKGYRIARYIMAALLFLVSASQIYAAFAKSGLALYSPYATVVDVALLSYLIMYKPSGSSIAQKVMKCIGYFMILFGVNNLRMVKYMTYGYGYSTIEINWGMLLATAVIQIVGIVMLVISFRKTKPYYGMD